MASHHASNSDKLSLDSSVCFHLRAEKSSDFAQVEDLTRRAFWNVNQPGCDEHYLLHVMRKHEDFLHDLSTVAVVTQDDGLERIVGHIAYTKSKLVLSKTSSQSSTSVLSAFTFGPISVDPAWQRRGVGKSLIHHTFAQIQAQWSDCVAVIIYGNPGNYVSAGFCGSFNFRIAAEGGKYPSALLVHAFQPEKLQIDDDCQWIFHESSIFGEAANEPFLSNLQSFDAQYPPWEKKKTPSQELFSILCRSTVSLQDDQADE
jgi:predicted N-acetyltransferase YhbS